MLNDAEPGTSATSPAVSGHFTVETLWWSGDWQQSYGITRVTWRVTYRPVFALHPETIRRKLDMPDIDPHLLYPTRLRVTVWLYDPTVQRYRYMRQQARHTIIETDDQYRAVLLAIDTAIAKVDANRT
jgi:hypothetical protein